MNRFAYSGVDAGVKQADESARQNQTIDRMTVDEVGRLGNDLRRFVGEILIRLAQQSEAFVNQRNSGWQQSLDVFEVRLVRRCGRQQAERNVFVHSHFVSDPSFPLAVGTGRDLSLRTR